MAIFDHVPPYVTLYNRITYPTPKLYNTNSNPSPRNLVQTTSQQNTTNQWKIIVEIAAQ